MRNILAHFLTYKKVQTYSTFCNPVTSYIVNKQFCYRENVIESVYTQVQCPTHSIYYPQQTAARTTLFSTWVTGY